MLTFKVNIGGELALCSRPENLLHKNCMRVHGWFFVFERGVAAGRVLDVEVNAEAQSKVGFDFMPTVCSGWVMDVKKAPSRDGGAYPVLSFIIRGS